MQDSISQPVDLTINQKNLSKNKMLADTYEFMSYVSKIEILFQKLQDYLFWIGISELFLFIILFIIFCINPKDMGRVWWFIFHVFRALFGFIILAKMPRTYDVIEMIYISDDLDSVKNNLIETYFNLLKSNQGVLKPVLFIYFLITVLCILIDINMFCVVSPDFGAKNKEKIFFVQILSNIILILGDLIYFNFFSSFKYYFPKSQNEKIQQATVLGFFDQLKVGMAKQVVNAVNVGGIVAGKVGKVGGEFINRLSGRSSDRNRESPFKKNTEKEERNVDINLQ